MHVDGAFSLAQWRLLQTVDGAIHPGRRAPELPLEDW